MRHIFTPEQAAFIRHHVKGRTNQELTDMVNERFGLSLKTSQIAAYKKNHKLSSGLTGRFEKGHTPFNKGKKGTFHGGPAAEAHQFPKGHKAWNWMPIGSERVNADGYVDVKVDDGKKQKNWKGKHILIWEQHHGPVPKGHVVIFGDGDNRNFDPDNLVLISRAQLALMNKHGLIQNDADLTRTGAIVADLHIKIGQRKRSASQ